MKVRPLLVLFGLALYSSRVEGFVRPQHEKPPWTRNLRSDITQLRMVFDFFRERTSEGLDQLSNIAGAAYKGNLGQGLKEAVVYTQLTNDKFRNGLEKSRNRFLQNLEMLLTGNSEDLMEDLVDLLLQADLGMATSEDIVSEVKSLRQSSSQRIISRDDLMSIMRGTIVEALDTGKSSAITFSEDSLPTVIFVMGANGMGKTTTIGKLAYRLRTEGNQTVLLAACDTFRAGAVDQLVQWADRAEVDCFVPNESRNSPSAVLYGALDKALAESYDTVLVDTSGRLSNNEALNAELAKMKRVIQKRLSIQRDSDNKPVPNTQVPHETLLVIDAAQGRMALDSAKVWNEELDLSGLILTKLDGSARGGSVVAVSRELGLPVKLIGVGEGIEDLRDFEAEIFVDGLLGIGAAGGGSSTTEGVELSARLATMRQERDLRTSATKDTVETVLEAPSVDFNLQSVAVENSRFNSSPSTKKKRKKKKRKRR